MKRMSGIPVLVKSVRVLRAVAEGRASGSMQGLARELKIAPATCHRILRTLIDEDFVRPASLGGYTLSGGLHELAGGDNSRGLLIEVADEPLRELVAKTRLAGKVSIRRGDEAMTVARAESPRAMAVSGRIGASFPLVFGSSGGALLADAAENELDRLIGGADVAAWRHQTREDFRHRVAEARRRGVCGDWGGYHPHVHALSAPIRSGDKRVAAAITLMGLPGDFDSSRRAVLSRRLLAAARSIERSLSGRRGASTKRAMETIQ